MTSESRSSSVALLTPNGRGAVATIRVEADANALERSSKWVFQAANGNSLSQQPIGKIVFGRWGSTLETGEEVVVCRVEATATEIHCHGGDAAAHRIIEDLNQSGCEVLNWREQLASSHDILEMECLEGLSRATTWRTAELLLEQSFGTLREGFQQLVRLAADETRQSELLAAIDSLLKWSKFGLHLSQPWDAVLTGRPNVGKSSLINALLGYQRAIVFDQPGTTRDVVTAETAFEGWPVMLADTAGLRETTEELEAAGIALARQSLETADLRLVLIDLSDHPTKEDESLIAEWHDAIIVAHKCDLTDHWGSRIPQTAIRVSSITGQGLDELQRELVRRLVPEVPPPGTPIPISPRQIELLQAARKALSESELSSASVAISGLLTCDVGLSPRYEASQREKLKRPG